MIILGYTEVEVLYYTTPCNVTEVVHAIVVHALVGKFSCTYACVNGMCQALYSLHNKRLRIRVHPTPIREKDY